MTRPLVFALLAVLVAAGCDLTAPSASARVQCLGPDPVGTDLFPFEADDVWTFDYVLTSMQSRLGTVEELPGTLTWAFGEGSCQDSLWVVPVTERAVMADGFVYAEEMAVIREASDGTLRYDNEHTHDREVTFIFEFDRFQTSPPDTVVLGEIQWGRSVALVPERGVVGLEGYHYYGTGLTRTLDAAR